MQDGRWRAAVTVGKDAYGKPKRKVFTAATRHEVKDQLNDALKDLKLGRLVAPEKQTVGQFLTWWLEAVVKPSARPKTMKAYEYQSAFISFQDSETSHFRGSRHSTCRRS
jgi:hypothetical protein